MFSLTPPKVYTAFHSPPLFSFAKDRAGRKGKEKEERGKKKEEKERSLSFPLFSSTFLSFPSIPFPFPLISFHSLSFPFLSSLFRRGVFGRRRKKKGMESFLPFSFPSFPVKGKVTGSISAKVVLKSEGKGAPGMTMRLEPKVQTL